MKKSIIKTIVFLGFTLFILGVILDPLMNTAATATVVSGLTYIAVAAILGMAFIFSKNSTMSAVGFGLCAFVGAIGVVYIMNSAMVNLTVIPVGLIVMFVGAVLEFLLVAIQFFGFFKSNKSNDVGNVSEILLKYKDLEKEKVISQEEFNELKNKIIATSSADSCSIEDMKKWKKLLDQEIITEEEFSNMKSKIFKK